MIRTFITLAAAAFPAMSFAQESASAPVPGGGYVALIALHVVLGILGIAALYIATMALLKKLPNVRFVRWTSFVSTLSFIASWITGGIYYVFYYGGPVKAAIKAGANPWAHNFLMEAKEHVFLLLPFVALTVFVVAWRAGNRLASDDRLRRTLFWLALVGTLIGVFSALAGVVISGSTTA